VTGPNAGGDPDRVTVAVETGAPGGATNAYLLDPPGGLLVDPAGADADLDALAADAAHVAVTHHHPDHVGAVARYADEATVWARAGRADDFAAATGVDPDRTFSDGTRIPTGRGAVEVIGTPGHAPEHAAFAVPEGVAVGDLAVAEGSVAVAAPEGDLRAYLASLRRLFVRAPDRLYPAHGPVIDRPRETLARLLAHRRDRERRVLAAVRGGARTPDEVVDAAYEKDLSGVREAARATVVAHLEKLAVEGVVAWDGRRVAPAGP